MRNDRHQASETALRFRGEKRDGPESREGTLFVDHGREFVLAILALLAREIPLVPHRDQAFSFLENQSGEAALLSANALHRIDAQNRDIAAGDRAERTARGVVF